MRNEFEINLSLSCFLLLIVFQTTWSLNHGIDASEILKEFPDELRGDVSLHMHREMLSLPIFETAPQGISSLINLYNNYIIIYIII